MGSLDDHRSGNDRAAAPPPSAVEPRSPASGSANQSETSPVLEHYLIR